MGLTERHWFENEDVPENYEWALEDAVYNSRTNKKHDDDIVRCKNCKYWDEGHTEECDNILIAFAFITDGANRIGFVLTGSEREVCEVE